MIMGHAKKVQHARLAAVERSRETIRWTCARYPCAKRRKATKNNQTFRIDNNKQVRRVRKMHFTHAAYKRYIARICAESTNPKERNQ